MKKKIVMISLIAIFISANALIAQTPSTTSPCCKGKTTATCKDMTAAEKTKCMAESKKEGTKACTKKVDTKSTVVVKK